ncbi:LOW QUALITY PROTEIN: transcription factor IBH1-like 1 [Macadamia integrifolia]|uniref:LOW QUALITY PROTEIN: transcription factor IBH1-like 1 n=1 Tax=Macadamia integrifolia TaxID=60698 RepID=UPI001C4F2B8C|nr:LOW QUALITY PROTEIN: transcription factor IBH1-like 1 [Macadamia integrifolia]
MAEPSTFKQDLLRRWVMGLKSFGSSIQDMDFLERKKAIKLSADVAMASLRGGKTCWSRALIANASKQEEGKTLVRNILGSHEFENKTSSKPPMGTFMSQKRVRSKNILRRSFCSSRRIRKIAPKRVQARSIAKRLVKKRTQVLRCLVPGGESMDDEFSLLEETLDYILSLRAQVDVMRCLADASELLNGK